MEKKHLVSALCLMLILAYAYATVPRLLTIQGRLREGGVLANGDYNFVFLIYNTSSGGTPLWQETHTNVSVNRGYFSVVLGDYNTLSLDFKEQYWLGIRVNNDPEMTPRLRLTDASYAFVAIDLNVQDNLNIDSGTLYVDIENNRVGIGTTSPDYKLTVAGSIYTTELGGFRIGISGASPEYGIRMDTATSGGWARELSWSHSGSKVASIGAYGSASNTNYLYFNANQGGASTGYSSPHMVITSSGNVGIGTTSPVAKLEVNGKTILRGRLQLGHAATTWINDTITGFNEPVVTNDGFIIVPGYTGTEDSDLRLYITDNANDRFSIWGDTCGGGNCGELDNASLAHYFTAGGNAYHKGNVGIGTTSPEAKLHVSASDPVVKITDTTTADNGATLWLQENDSYGVKLRYNSASNTFFNIDIVDGGTSTTRFAIDRYGNVGIGTTSPSAKLEIAGDFAYQTVGQTSRLVRKKNIDFILNDTNDHFLFKTNSMGNGAVAWAKLIIQSGDAGNEVIKEVLINVRNSGGTNYVYVTPTIGTNKDIALVLKYANNTDNSGVTEFYIAATQALGWYQNINIEGYNISFDSSGLSPSTLTTVPLDQGINIDQSGNVGIGTTSPDKKLHVYSSSGGGVDAANGLLLEVGDSAGSWLRIKNSDRLWGIGQDADEIFQIYDATAGAARLAITTSGNVGIGTTSPSYKLHVDGNAYSSQFFIGGTGLCIGSDCITDWSDVGGGSSLWTDAGSYIYPNNYSSFVITDDGKVGIGTTNPQSRLQVHSGFIIVSPDSSYATPRGTVDASDEVLRAIGPTSDFIISVQDGTGRVQFYWNSSTYDETYLVSDEAAGKILFHPPGNPLFSISYAPAGTAGDPITWSEYFRINTNGNVGIGTTSPSYKLDVAGGGRFSSDIYVGSNKVWHAGNDGSGSGLDADMIDGIDYTDLRLLKVHSYCFEDGSTCEASVSCPTGWHMLVCQGCWQWNGTSGIDTWEECWGHNDQTGGSDDYLYVNETTARYKFYDISDYASGIACLCIKADRLFTQ